MTDMLPMYIDVQHKTWREVLPYVTFAYNTATQETTRFTPFRLLYDRDVQTMLDAMLPCDIDNIDNLDEDAECFVQRAEEARTTGPREQQETTGRTSTHGATTSATDKSITNRVTKC